MTISTLRPNSTVASGGSLTGAASIHAALSDDSDASFVTLQGQQFTVGLGDLSLPAGAVVKTVAVRVRVNTGDPLTMTTTLDIDPEDVIANTLVTWALTTTVTVASSAVSYADAAVDAATLQIAQADAGVLVTVFEAYVDATYVAKPTVVITGPSGTITDNNRPTIQWTPGLDSDGGSQTRFRAVVMANGEHPDTHTPIADSGVVISALANWTPDAPLANATYDIYVKVAQTVNGNLHWSDWDDQQDVILNVAAPATPTSITVTPESSQGRVKLAVAEGAGGTVITDKYRFQRSRDAGTTWADVRTDEGGGILRVPTVVGAVGAFTDAADGTTHAATLPAPAGGILADDLLIAFVAMDGNPTVSWPSGWTEIKDEAGNGSAVRVACAWKRADGGEGGTITVTTSASEGGAVHILCVRGAEPTTAPTASTGANAAGTSADPDSLNPAGWGTEDTLWIAAAVNDGNVAISSGPANYFGFLNSRWANASGSGVATATKRTTAASEDPGAFTLASAEDSRAFTVGVRPIRALPVAYDYEGGNGESVKYRVASVHDFSSGSSSSSAWVTSGTTSWVSTAWILKHPYDPSLNVVVVPRSQPTRRRAARWGKFKVLGRAKPVGIGDVREGWEGDLVLRLDTKAERDALDAILDEMVPLLLQAPAAADWDDTWLIIEDQGDERVVDNANYEHRFDSIPWTEVDEPTGAIIEWP